MPILSNQCRAARGLFAMTQQELANASGVSLRTISSFEDASDRQPIAANLTAIQNALQRLGVVFKEDGGVEWSSPFSETQTDALLALSTRSGPRMITSKDLIKRTGCSRADLELFSQLCILDGIDGLPLWTPIGLHIAVLLREYEAREKDRRKMISLPMNYTVKLDDETVFHAPTATVFRIEQDGTLSILFEKFLPKKHRDDVFAGAREALRLRRERDPKISGSFSSH